MWTSNLALRNVVTAPNTLDGKWVFVIVTTHYMARRVLLCTKKAVQVIRKAFLSTF